MLRRQNFCLGQAGLLKLSLRYSGQLSRDICGYHLAFHTDTPGGLDRVLAGAAGHMKHVITWLDLAHIKQGFGCGAKPPIQKWTPCVSVFSHTVPLRFCGLFVACRVK